MSEIEKLTQRASPWTMKENSFIHLPENVARSLSANPGVDTILQDVQSTQLNTTLKKLLLQIKSVIFEKFPEAGFYMWEFGEKLEKMMEEVMKSKQIPLHAKTKFVRDIESRVEKLSDISVNQLRVFAAQSMTNSLSIEAIELYDKTRGQKYAYYLSKILEGTLAPYIGWATAGLKAVYADEKIKTSKGVLMSLNNSDNFRNEFAKLDLVYGLWISQLVAETDKNVNRGDITTEGMYGDIRKKILDHYAAIDPEFEKKTRQIRQTLKQNPNFQIYSLSSIPNVMTANWVIPVANVIESYRVPLVKFQGVEFETKKIKERVESSGFFNSVKPVLWLDVLQSTFEYIDVDHLIENMDKMSASDTAKLFVQFATLYPGIGDLISSTNGLLSAASGITLDGEKMNNLNRWVTALLSVLWVTLIGGLIIKGKNIAKIAKLMDKFALVRNNFPGKCLALLEKTKNLENGVLNAGIAGLKKALQISGGPNAHIAIVKIDALAIKSLESYRDSTGLASNAKVSPLKAVIQWAKATDVGKSTYVDAVNANAKSAKFLEQTRLINSLIAEKIEYSFKLSNWDAVTGNILELTGNKALMQYSKWNTVQKELVDVWALFAKDGRITAIPKRRSFKLPKAINDSILPSKASQNALLA